jgi:HNH endonuclease
MILLFVFFISMEIPLRNKHGDTIAHTIVSPEHFDLLNNYRWFVNQDYVISTIGNQVWKLHRFIMIKILGNDLTSKNLIDHINNDPLDNRHENLRVVTASENSRNRKKKENCSSQYMGVSKRSNGFFQVTLRIPGKRLYATYLDEIHAAFQYNKWIDEHNITCANKNNVEIPSNFVEYVSSRQLNELPNGITMSPNGKFCVKICIDRKTMNLGRFNSLEDAIEIRKKAESERDAVFLQRHLDIPKQYNELGQCFFLVKNTQVIIDEDRFHELIKYPWYITKKKAITSEYGILSRIVLNYTGDLIVDHINNNPADNRRENLRIVTPQQNSMNKSSAKNSSSQYLGVAWDSESKKWKASIYAHKKQINLGRFHDEIEAAKTRDIATKKYFGEYGNLNFP